jgi:hypothetical protein
VCSWGTFFFTAVLGTVVVFAKADSGVYEWAEKEAIKELKEEGVI